MSDASSSQPALAASDRRISKLLPKLWLGLPTPGGLLLLIAGAPAIGIQAYNEYDLRQARELEIRQQGVQTTRQFGEGMGELREGAPPLLLKRGQRPAVREKNNA